MIHRTFSGNHPPQSSSQIAHLRRSCKQLAPPFGSFGGIKEYDFLCLSLRSPCPLTANLPCASDVRLQTVRLPWVCVVHSGSGSLVSAFPSSPSFRSLSCVRSFRSSGSCLCCVFVRACNLQPFGWPHYTNQIAQLVWLVCSVFVRFTRSFSSFVLQIPRRSLQTGNHKKGCRRRSPRRSGEKKGHEKAGRSLQPPGLRCVWR